jgi:hypothetical protein
MDTADSINAFIDTFVKIIKSTESAVDQETINTLRQVGESAIEGTEQSSRD